MKKIVVFAFPSRFIFPVKLICALLLDQHQLLILYLNLLLSFYSICQNNNNVIGN